MVAPLIIGGILAGLGAAGAGGGAAAGIGKNPYRSSNFADTKHYDANRFEWGGSAGGADADAERFRRLAQNAQQRQGEQVDYTGANQDRALGLEARGGQAQLANAMQARAMGLVPSIASMEADRQMQQATAAQASAAAGARGAAGLALAQQNAAANTAAMQGAISNQAQINAAQERMAAEQAAFGAFSGMRGGDLASQQQMAQQAQYQSQLNAQQRAQNDQYALGLTGYEMGVRQAQLNAGQAQQQMLAQQHAGAQQTNAQINQNNANREMDFVKIGMGMAQGGADTATGMGLAGKRAGGGPVAPGQPYLVGELGPEIVVPSEAGTVLPNSLTQGLLGGHNPSAGPATASIDKLRGDGSMDVLGSLRAHGNVSTQFARNPTGGLIG